MKTAHTTTASAATGGHSNAWRLGYSDCMRYGLRRALRDYPSGYLQAEYEAGYAKAERKITKAALAKLNLN